MAQSDETVNELLLKDLIDRDAVYEWAFIDTADPWARVYFKPEEDQGGFRFYALQIRSVACPDHNDYTWHPEHTEIEILFHGLAYWDGIRHLYMGSDATDNMGYLYYPRMDVLLEILEILSDLSGKYCRE